MAYANAPVKVVEKWQKLLKAVSVSGRQTLRRAFVLIDARHGVKPVDDEIMKLLDTSRRDLSMRADQGRQGQSQGPRAKLLDQVRTVLAKHPAAFPEIVLTSSEKGDGISTLRSIIAGHLK